MKKLLIILFGLGIVTVGGYFLYGYKQKAEFNENLQQSIAKDQGLTETILKIEKESSTISYDEVFKLCEQSVTDRTDVIIKLRSLNVKIESALRDSLIGFLSAENELTRSKSQCYRSVLSLITNKKYYDQEFDRFSKSHYTVSEIYHSSLKDQMKDVFDDAKSIKRNINIFEEQYNLLSKYEDKLASLMHSEGLSFDPIFKKYSADNVEFMTSTKDYADLIIKNNQADYDFMVLNW